MAKLEQISLGHWFDPGSREYFVFYFFVLYFLTMKIHATLKHITKLRACWHLNHACVALDKQIFRFNIYLSLDSSVGRAEDCNWLKLEQISLGHWFEPGSRECFILYFFVLYFLIKVSLVYRYFLILYYRDI